MLSFCQFVYLLTYICRNQSTLSLLAYILSFSIPYQNYSIQNFHRSYLYVYFMYMCVMRAHHHSLSLECDFGKWGKFIHVSWNTRCQWFEGKFLPLMCASLHIIIYHARTHILFLSRSRALAFASVFSLGLLYSYLLFPYTRTRGKRE